MASWLPQVGLTLLPHVGGFLGGLITRNQVEKWYSKLDRPSWRPPNWVFFPVWTGLYTGMGYASYLVYRDGIGADRTTALSLYGTQLALNWMWTPIFFYYHKLGFATAEILLLDAAIIATAWSFFKINKTAGYIMLPYIAWVSFASLLTASVWKRNKGKKLD